MNTQVDKKDMITCNPVIGCTIGCPYCYARRMNQRFKFVPDFSVPTRRPIALDRIRRTHGKTLFMTSMSDLSGWDLEWRDIVFREIAKNPSNTYLFLTKNPDGLRGLSVANLPNVWIGVTVTNNYDLPRIQKLLSCVRAAHYWVCFEPLHSEIRAIPAGLKNRIGWVVIGDETGLRSGKIKAQTDWILDLSRQFPETPVCIKERLRETLGSDWRNEYPF